MSLKHSSLLPLGSQLPTFTLADPRSGRVVSDQEFVHEPTLVIVMCNHCPYVVHIKEGLAKLTRDLDAKGVKSFAISANDPEQHPIDAPEKMAQEASLYDYIFPYLFDEKQSVARQLQAVCTPEFYLFEKRGRLVYRGQMDDARPNNDAPNDGRDIRVAVSAMLDGAPPLDLQTPSVGCSIKWRGGNAPSYVGL